MRYVVVIKLRHDSLRLLLFFADSVAANDAGWYSCAAVSESGSSLARAEVKLADADNDRPPPIIQLGPTNQTLPEGSKATLPCQATAEDEIVWLKDGVPLESLQDKRISIQGDNTLLISGKTSLSKFDSVEI